MALYRYATKDDLANLKLAPTQAQTQIYDMIGRSAGTNMRGGNDDNFFAKRGKSIENAIGTTGAAIVSGIDSARESAKSNSVSDNIANNLDKIAQKYGFADRGAYWDALSAAEESGNTDELERLNSTVGAEMRGETSSAAKEADQAAKDWKDYRENSYVGQKINQDRGKFLGSAINTLSTGFDVMAPGAGIIANSLQGGIEGIADELEQNGLENFDWERAGQNALTGAATGAVTGVLNKGISNKLAKNGGNLFKGGNALTRGLNNLGSQTAAGRIGSTLATGAARGALSGAVGGATGAGLSAAMNGQDVLGSAIQGAQQGFGQGAFAGGIMAGANMAANATPGVGNVMRQLNEAGDNWKNSGDTFNERLTNTLTSGDSPVGEWLQGNTRSRALQKAGMIGNTIGNTEMFDNTGMRIPDNIAKRIANIDPRLLDEKGNIKVMYHGTPNGGFERPNDGTYFSENKRYADGYQNPSASSLSTKQNANNPMTYEGYLDIKKPFTLADQDARDIYLNEYIKGGNSQYYDPYTDYRKTIDGLDEVDWVEGENLREWLQQNHPEYDGLFLDEGGDGGYGDAEYRWRGKSVVPFSGDQFINRNNTSSNQQTPTTLGGWMKQAGKRIVEDANNRGVGMSIKNVADEQTIPQDIQNMRINNPYETETQAVRIPQEQATTQVANKRVSTPIEAENTLKTSKSEQLRYKAAQELLKQYGTVDKPTAKATNAPKTIQEIADAGFTKPGDVERIADNITGSNGEVNKLVQNLVATAKRVNTFDGLEGKTIDEFIDESIARNALDGINEGKAVKSQIKAYLNSLESRRSGSVDFSDAPEDVMDVVRGLEAEAANYEGRSGMNYGTTTQDKMNAAKVAKDVATLLKDRVFETVDVKSAMTPEVAQSLKALAPNNKQWSDYVDNKIMTAKNLQDLRSVQAPFVRAKKIIDNGYMNSVTYGGRLGNSVAGNIPTTKSGLIKDVVNTTWNSDFANRAKASALNKAADITDRFSGNGGNTGTTSGNTNQLALPSGEVSGQVVNPATRIYDAIGRTEGLSNAEQARTADYLVNAAQEAEIVPNAPTTGNLESVISPVSSANTSVYNSVYGNNGQMSNTQGQTQTGNSYFPKTGDYWTDVLGRAMSAAIEADDATAFASLYGMYQDSLANLQKQKKSNTSSQKLTATQQRANAAMDSLDRLSQMTPDLGYDLSGIPIIGGIATLGGNDYEGEAKSLAQQIGYMVSGANIKEEEAYNIGKSYVPQPFDSEQTRKLKLQRAYNIIRQYQNSTAEE